MNMEDGLNLTLGLPGRDESEKEFKNNSNSNSNKRCLSHETMDESKGSMEVVVGWPPVRRTKFQAKKRSETGSGMYVKVSMDGAPYLRKIDLKVYKGYSELLKALENMFKMITIGSEYAPTYQDKDGDWMLVGDVPWEMFMVSCKRMRIMKRSEAQGLGCNL
ncbi:hypothetical protein SSX86_016531 [Deinandra increscens subsp. villosa]|uniref:Auxin-responsive protein n=1 Tax=Deinandra increscens subsp. villosa TaxID=3103831 RepID=A0AAP0D2E4_9ASTR